MGKPKHQRTLSDQEAQAVTRNLRVSPRKLNLVAGLIRGKKVDTALADLQFSRKRIAQDVRKCVMSAVANAENNHGLDVNDLVVSEAYVGKNLVMKRFAARGRGRASSITKPFSQITVIVRQTEAEEGEGKRHATKAKSTKQDGKGDKKPASKVAKGAPAKDGKPAKSPKQPEAKAGKTAKPDKREDASAKSKSSAKPGKPGKGKETE
jgi:large subunit ribosomal protein L22